jgi:hypothetical protein
MNHGRCYHRDALHLNLRGHIAIILFLSLLLPACGVVFIADFEGTEVFRDIEIEGDFVAGSPISVALTVRQPYPVPVAISCRFENADISDDQRRVVFAERSLSVFETILEPNPGPGLGDEDVDPEDMEQRFEFTVDEPGEYFLACFTLAALENGIGQRFTVE